MQEQEIIEGNKIIAEFMEWYNVGYSSAYNHPIDPNIYNIEEFKYYSSWDWLKPVIDKISEIDYAKYSSKCIEYISVVAMSILTPIEEAFKRVINFIKWYNSCQKQKEQQ